MRSVSPSSRQRPGWVSLAILGCALAVTADAPAQPARVLLIRHAEKPDNKDDIHLSAKGEDRAKGLHRLFEKSADRPDPLPRPDFIFAARQSEHSNRSVETVTPLSKVLKVPVDDRFADEEHEKLASELLSKGKYTGKVVLVCWHHEKLPKLAKNLKASDVPDKWKDSVFDRVWAINYGKGGNGVLTKRHQGLLPGDDPEK